jgi:hypothetical protein
MDGPVVKITKMDTPSKIPVKPVEDRKLDGGKKTKNTTKTYPRGILKTSKVKIKAVSDPAKHPPLKKFMKKHTIRMLTETGSQHRRKTIKKKIDKMTDSKVKDMVIKAGLSKGSGPSSLLRQILEGGMLSGFVSSG